MFKRSILFIFLINFSRNLFSAFPINLFRAYDINFRTQRWDCERFEAIIIPEFAIDIDGRNNENKVNILQIWNQNQNALAMVRGFDLNSEIGQIAASLNNVNDDGIRGHFLPTAKLKALDCSFTGKYYLPHNFSVYFFLPVFSMKLTDVNFKNLTKDILAIDQQVKNILTDDFENLVNRLGGPSIKGWKKTGLGDLVGTVEWYQNFPQAKPFLKNVAVSIRAGATFPTGVKKDEDELFSIPFGFDGSFGIMFGGGLDLTWGCHLKGGVDVEFLKLFGHEKERRIKTDPDQTDLLFLAKTKTFKEYGILQRFNLYLEAYKFLKGLSFRAAYQFYRNDEDRLWLFDNKFSTAIANSAENLQEWTLHQLLFILNYDFLDDPCQANSWVPRLSLYCKVPFEGVRSVQATTVGLMFSLSF